jgi:DNA-binding CsgD family transcriptional regulator
MTTAPQQLATSGPGITSLIPARIDKLPWSRFHTRLVAALRVAWTLDGLEITIASNAGPDLSYACNTGAVADLTQAAALAVESRLGQAEPDRVLLPALIRAALGLLERHAGNGPAEAALTCDAAKLPGEARRAGLPLGGRAWPDEPLTDSEARVLRYLPTHMGAPEIAAELYVSANTVKTHLRHVYRKLGAHSRQEAVQRARAIGLLAVPSGRRWDARRPDGPEYGKADRHPAQLVSLSKGVGNVR